MKMWIKYLLGVVLGIIAAFILPENFVSFITEFALRFGHYMVLPVLFFGASAAFFRLRTSKKLLLTAKWSAVTIISSSLILTFTGILSIMIMYNLAVPSIMAETDRDFLISSINLRELLMSLLPYSQAEGFSTIQAGAYLLPCFILVGFAGAGCAIDTTASKPVVSFIESAEKVCYSVMCFFVEWFSVALVALSCSWMIQTSSIENISTFMPFIILLLADFVFIVAIVYPLILRFLCKDHHPYHVLYAAICPIITGFFSGNSNLTMLINLRHGRDSLGIHQPVSDVTFPLFSIFARGGSALATTIGFVMIIRSDSSMELSLATILFIFVISFLISFVLGALPANGALFAIATICSIYGKNLDNRYLYISPAAPVFCSFAAALDAATAMFGAYIVGVKTKMIEHIEVKRYV